MADKKNVYQKLVDVQQTLIAPKNQFNKFGNYKYRSCEDILEGLKPCLKKVGAAVVIEDNLISMGERFYIQAVAKFIDAETGDTIENTAYAREEESKKGMDGSQVTGSSSSYARKYALNGLFCIDDVKDADSRDNSEQAPAKKPTINKKPAEADRKISDDEIAQIKSEFGRTGVAEEVILKTFKVKAIEEMTATQFVACMNKFNVTPNKKEEK